MAKLLLTDALTQKHRAAQVGFRRKASRPPDYAAQFFTGRELVAPREIELAAQHDGSVFPGIDHLADVDTIAILESEGRASLENILETLLLNGPGHDTVADYGLPG